MKLLVIENEPKIVDFLRTGLRENGYVVDVALDGVSGLHLATTGDYDLVVLDIMLPEKDGWSVLSELRRSGSGTPVLLLTARDAVDDRVRGFDLGADDYLIKPFAFAELLARIRNALRRAPARTAEELTIDDLAIDLRRHRVTRNGIAIELTPKEFLLLTLLVQRQGEVLSRTVIAEQVWDMNFDSDTNVVDVNIGRLRGKVDGPFARKLIHTVRGLGYVAR